MPIPVQCVIWHSWEPNDFQRPTDLYAEKFEGHPGIHNLHRRANGEESYFRRQCLSLLQ